MCKKKIKGTCLTTLKASIRNITILTERSGSGSVRWTDSTASQSLFRVLADRLQPGVVALQLPRHRLTGCRVRATDRAAASSVCETDDDAFESFERPLARVLEFLHTE